MRQQKNLEAIVQQAALAITDQSKPVDDKPVDPDWTAFFLNQSQNVSDEQMRGGDPFATLDPGRVTGIAFTLPSATDDSSYSVDFTLDDIRLIPIPH